MNKKISIREKWQGLTDTVMRFPLTVILLIAAIVTNVISIESSYEIIYTKLLVTFLLGAFLFVVLQLFYERFLDNPIFRIVFMLLTVVFAATYFMLIRNSMWRVEVTIRTTVLLFILFIAFLWIPSIQNTISINESIMAVLKGSFTALFFDGVLFLGTVIIIGATNQLIFRVNEDAYIHSANIIFILLAPIYFLTMIPYYPGKREESDRQSVEAGKDNSSGGSFREQAPEEDSRSGDLLRMTTPAKFLETLISYVIIPITAIFTIILLLYIIINIRSEFWSNNLMESMLVTYSITVIVVYLLSSTIQKPFARTFRLVFPKVLIPVVLFQTLSSILKISDVGVTYGRYYVILFGIFATTAGVLFSFLPIRKNGIIAPILITLSIISILPPVDAFTLSKVNQTVRLEGILSRNNMLNNNIITPNSNLTVEDKSDLVSAFNYLDTMQYNDIDFLKAYYETYNFEKTFGFERYGNSTKDYRSYYYSRNTTEPVPVAGYDFMTQMSIFSMADIPEIGFEIDTSLYYLRVDNNDKENQILLVENSQGEELVRFEYNNLFTEFPETNEGKEFRSLQEMTFTSENEKAGIMIIANNISVNEWESGKDRSADMIILIDIR